jgi:hypothetical protein
MSLSNNHSMPAKVKNWGTAHDALTTYDEFEDDLKTDLRALEGGYLLTPALIPEYYPDPVAAFVPIPALPAGGLAALGAPGGTVAQVEARLKALDRYNTQFNAHATLESRVNALRAKHRTVCDRSIARLQNHFDHSCAAYRKVRELVASAPAGSAPHEIFLRAFNGIKTQFKPDKPVNAQHYMDRLNALRSDDGRGWSMYSTDFQECMDALIQMGQTPSIGNAQSYITTSFRHTKLMHYVTAFIVANNADVLAGLNPDPPRWRILLEDVALQINAAASFDIVSDAQAFVDVTHGGKNGAVHTPFCYRCWRAGHHASVCTSYSCAGCNAKLITGVYHDSSTPVHVKPRMNNGGGGGGANGGGAGRGGGGAGRGAGGRGGRGGSDGAPRGPDRGGRGGRSGGRGYQGRGGGDRKRKPDHDGGGGESKRVMKARALVARTDAAGSSSSSTDKQTATNTAANQAATKQFMASLGNR